MTGSDHIIIRNLSHCFHSGQQPVQALKALSFSVKHGEFLTLIGPSGCGKSTLLNIVSGLIGPKTDEPYTLLVDGETINGPDPRRIAMVFQESGLFPWRTATQNVEFGLELRGVRTSDRRRAAREYLALVGLLAFTDRYPGELSGGMQQRVSLARALAINAPIMLLDEPFGALDEQTRLLMSEELLKIWSADKKTVLFVTHSLHEAAALSDRILVMTARPGQIKEIIEPRAPRPRNPATIDAIRDELWNLLKEESRKALEQTSGTLGRET